MPTNFYVDGPNLYYAALKDKTIRWLDLVTWCERLFPEEDVKRVRYFTAWPQPVRNREQANRLSGLHPCPSDVSEGVPPLRALRQAAAAASRRCNPRRPPSTR